VKLRLTAVENEKGSVDVAENKHFESTERFYLNLIHNGLKARLV
jgi:hypothetical protein